MAFTDDFNRSNENLEASANWTLVTGTAGSGAVASNVLVGTVSASDPNLYHCPDQGSADQYVQAAFLAAAQTFICARATDGNNFFGLRYNSGAWQLFKRVSGTFTQLDSYTATLTAGDIGKIECSGNSIEVFVNGVSRIGPVTDSFNNTETRQGVSMRQQIAGWIDDFEAGALGGSASVGPRYYYAQQ